MYWDSIIGGIAIGAGASLLMLSAGRIAGITGMVATSLTRFRQQLWAPVFLLGLVLGGLIGQQASSVPPPALSMLTLSHYLVGGLLVGLGTRWGKGCTSGHGVCGIARLSPRSILATLIFMLTGSLTATFLI